MLFENLAHRDLATVIRGLAAMDQRTPADALIATAALRIYESFATPTMLHSMQRGTLPYAGRQGVDALRAMDERLAQQTQRAGDHAAFWASLAVDVILNALEGGEMAGMLATSLRGMRGSTRQTASALAEGIEVAVENAGEIMCFEAGTMVHTPNGMRPIEDLIIGDQVVSRDELTGVVDTGLVTATFVTENQQVMELHLADQLDDLWETLRVTPSHPLWVSHVGWVAAGHLEIGDLVLSATGHWLSVEGASVQGDRVTVYNIEVQDHHTYFAGYLGVLVHNHCGRNRSRGPRPAVAGDPWHPDSVAGRTGSNAPLLSGELGADLGAHARTLSRAERGEMRARTLEVASAIQAQSLRTDADLARAFPDRNVHMLTTSHRGWISIDPVAGNRSALGGLRIHVRLESGGVSIRIRAH
jgi:hypothetical protein